MFCRCTRQTTATYYTLYTPHTFTWCTSNLFIYFFSFNMIHRCTGFCVQNEKIDGKAKLTQNQPVFNPYTISVSLETSVRTVYVYRQVPHRRAIYSKRVFLSSNVISKSLLDVSILSKQW